ncbi:endoribonuclease Dicer homolog 2-like [Gastrolobium bilobum]|uniref:endoribonuclease Dicer homolog 2-like n=1 Tax=Gastrolobium bilobum TaxID=150636 RepID=UPI002AAFF895|nr:endoribonuclease Dicer homolog 2-like [Gastrolobium bilobum]
MAYVNEQPSYVPPELVSCSPNACNTRYYCYLIEMRHDFNHDIPVHDIVLSMGNELDSEITSTSFDMFVDKGNMSVNLTHVETIDLSPNEVQKCRRFQTTLFRILVDRSVKKLICASDEFSLGGNPEIDYLLLPATAKHQRSSSSIVDWKPISSFPFSPESACDCKYHFDDEWTKTGLVCSCKLKNCVVSTPHNGSIYIISDIVELNGNSHLVPLRGSTATTFKEYFKNKYSIELSFEDQSLLQRRSVFKVNNYLVWCRQKKEKGLNSNLGCSYLLFLILPFVTEIT